MAIGRSRRREIVGRLTSPYGFPLVTIETKPVVERAEADTVAFETSDDIAWVKFNRPEKRNCMSLFVANCQLSGSGELIQPAAVGSPLKVVKVNHAATSSGDLADRSAAIQ